jgi:hypothetical protein
MTKLAHSQVSLSNLLIQDSDVFTEPAAKFELR